MACEVDIRRAGEYLHAVVSGACSFEESCAAYTQIVAAAHAHKLLKILVDMRGVSSVPTPRERIDFGVFGSQLRLQALADGKPCDYKITFVVPPARDVDPKDIGLTEARRRGWDDLIGIFQRVEDAAAWLGVARGP
jgi:hypothetical protein